MAALEEDLTALQYHLCSEPWPKDDDAERSVDEIFLVLLIDVLALMVAADGAVDDREILEAQVRAAELFGYFDCDGCRARCRTPDQIPSLDRRVFLADNLLTETGTENLKLVLRKIAARTAWCRTQRPGCSACSTRLSSLSRHGQAEAPWPVSCPARICYLASMKSLLAAAFIAFLAETPLADPAEEARAQSLMREIRCVACENEPASQSSAAIAEDMRIRIREMVEAGASDKEVRDWFVSRYGEFVLFRPPARDPSGWLLWGLPFGLLATGVVTGLILARKAGRKSTEIEAEDV